MILWRAAPLRNSNSPSGIPSYPPSERAPRRLARRAAPLSVRRRQLDRLRRPDRVEPGRDSHGVDVPLGHDGLSRRRLVADRTSLYAEPRDRRAAVGLARRCSAEFSHLDSMRQVREKDLARPEVDARDDVPLLTAHSSARFPSLSV